MLPPGKYIVLGGAMEIIAVVVGAVIGGLAVWFYLKGKSGAQEQELRQQLTEANGKLIEIQEIARAAGEERARAQASLGHAETRIADLTRERDEARQGLEKARVALADLQRTLEVELAKIAEERKSLQAQMEQLAKNKTELTQAFTAAAKDLFQNESAEFRRMNTEEVGKALAPFRDQLTGLQKDLSEAAKDRHVLGTHIERIALEANSLTSALKGDPKAQGDWGQTVLESLLQNSGLVKDVNYFVQKSFKDNEGRTQILDALIKLPDGRDLVVDAKVTITEHERYHAATTDEEGAQHLGALVQSFKTHIKGLSDKHYEAIPGLQTIDAVLMFVPVEAALNLAIQKDRTILEFAHQRRIIPVSATTIFAVIKVVERLWQYEKQVKSVQAVIDRASKLYEKFVGVTEAFDALQAAMRSADKAYHEARSRLLDGPGSVSRQLEQMRELGGLPVKKRLDGDWKGDGTVLIEDVGATGDSGNAP